MKKNNYFFFNFFKGADFVNSFKTDERIFFLFNEDTTNDDSEPINNRPARVFISFIKDNILNYI